MKPQEIKYEPMKVSYKKKIRLSDLTAKNDEQLEIKLAVAVWFVVIAGLILSALAAIGLKTVLEQ
jgi:hypothetical protein